MLALLVVLLVLTFLASSIGLLPTIQVALGDVSGAYSLVVVAGIVGRATRRGQLRSQAGRLRFPRFSAPADIVAATYWFTEGGEAKIRTR